MDGEGNWQEWRRFVLDGLRTLRESQSGLLKEHQEMYRWFGVVKVIVPILLGAMLAVGVAVVTAVIQNILGLR